MNTLIVNSRDELKQYIDENGNLTYGGGIKIKCDLYIKGDLYCGGNLNCKGYLYCKGDLYCEGNLYCHILYWSHMSKPNIQGEINIKRVLPPYWQLNYWQERFNGIVEIENDMCYDDILKLVVPKIDDILKLDKWTPTERWMLEFLRREE